MTMKYTLRQLEVFLAIAHHENVSRAAEFLSMSQSACSGALKELENQFGIRLFDRIGKRLQTNEMGRQLRPRAESVMQQAQELQTELEEHKHGGLLKIGATLTIGNYLCVPLMQRYMLEEGARAKLEVANTTSIARKLLNFDIDIGMIEGEINHPDLEMLPWLEDELLCFCAAAHPLAKKTRLNKADVLTAPWITREPGSGTRQIFERGMGELFPQLKIQLELQHTEAIKRAVEAGMGLSCLSRIALKDAIARGNLVPLTTPGLNFRRKFYLVLHKDKYRSAGITRWLDICFATQAKSQS